MQCPKCKEKLMAVKKLKNKLTLMRCVKCGNQFEMQDGRIKQRKCPKKNVKVTVYKDGKPINADEKNDESYHQYKKAQEHLEHVKRMNEMANRISRNPGQPPF